jgi:phosphate:Na+ symporter
VTATIFELLGGIGLFLLGMTLLTDGLKAFAGPALQRALARFTGTPAKAFASGALVTLLVQSSSATTVTLIGFVSAGLIPFAQAVGVVMGASLGTTGTGWIVSVLGLKVSLGFYALPMVGVGALMRLLGRGRARALGLALAGFGLIFVGIETLQSGMKGLADAFDLARLPAAGLAGHLAAMAIGIGMTVVMQSSSAAAATTLTALHSGAINFEQAASLVIGAAVGTTATGALAAIGGSVPAKRTALAHVAFNLATGAIAIVLLPLLLRVLEVAQRHAWLEPGAVSLAAFHTLFIGIGVAVFLPFADRLARRIERLLPDHGPRFTRHLDDSLLAAPTVAVEAARRALADTAIAMLAILEDLVERRPSADLHARRAEVTAALERIQAFLGRVSTPGEPGPDGLAPVAALHALDHLMRLERRLRAAEAAAPGWEASRALPSLEPLREVVAIVGAVLGGQAVPGWNERLEALAEGSRQGQTALRLEVLHDTAAGRQSPATALTQLDAVRWVARVCEHLWRATVHLAPPS